MHIIQSKKECLICFLLLTSRNKFCNKGITRNAMPKLNIKKGKNLKGIFARIIPETATSTF
jgi:hypothetical protein